MNSTPKITADDLRSERTWQLQHGFKDLTDGGMSSMEAQRAVNNEVIRLSDLIDKMEKRT